MNNPASTSSNLSLAKYSALDEIAAFMIQLNLNFTHACRYTRVLARLTSAKLQKLACACTVACDFGMHTWDSKHTWHTRDTCHKLTLGLPHYTCGVTIGTVAVGNEIQLLCS